VPTEGTDIWALKNNYISISPMQMSLGSPEQMPEVESLLAGLAGQLLPPRGELLT
jgi:broad specificity polyphosphatase/5'/3'-nucleotidase SurE